MKKLFILIIIVSTTIIAEDLKFNALAYFNYSYTSNSDTDISNQFEFRRVYFGLEKKISNTLTYKFLTDVGRKSEDGRLEVYIKNAKVDWKTAFGKFVFGLQGMNLFPVQEKTWGYRSIEKSTMDKNKFASSAAMGLGYFNNFGRLNYSVLLSNGAGYKAPEFDSYKKISTQLYIGESKLNSVNGWNLGVVFSYEPSSQDDYTIVEGVFCGYSSNLVRVGIEYDILNNTNLADPINIFSGYANAELTKIIELFGRVDLKNAGDYDSKYFIGGISINPEKGLKIMPNIRWVSDTNSKSYLNYNLNFEFNIS